jgi:hypothetical protein
MIAPAQPTLLVERPQRRTVDGASEVAAWLRLDGQSHHVQFRAADRAMPMRVEPFLALALFPAMKLGLTLRTETACSPLFLANLACIQDKFLGWDPTLSRVQIHAPAVEAPKPSGPRRIGAFFSGGVDSFHTLFRYTDQLSDLVFVHGFDIPAREAEFYEQNARLYEKMAADFGKRLVRVWTNLREFTDRYVDWGLFAHGPALAAVALLLEPELERMVIPGEYFPADGVPPPRGSHPETDPLWRTEHLTLIHDGFDRTRAQKLADLQQHAVVRRLLRVCWQRKTKSYNCCICGKCLRNMAILRALGVLDQFTSFHRPLDSRKLARQPVTMAHWRDMLKEILALLGTPGKDPELWRAVQECLAGRHAWWPQATIARCWRAAGSWVCSRLQSR